MTTAEIADRPIGSQVEVFDGSTWQKDAAGQWREVGAFGALGRSAFTDAQLHQGLSPVTTWQM